MTTTDQYRQRAEECVRLAQQSADPDLRRQYLHLAECYRELADAQGMQLDGKEYGPPSKARPSTESIT